MAIISQIFVEADEASSMCGGLSVLRGKAVAIQTKSESRMMSQLRSLTSFVIAVLLCACFLDRDEASLVPPW